MTLVRSCLRVRIDECGRDARITPGSLLGLFDEARRDLYEALVAAGVTLPAQHAARAERLVVATWPASRQDVQVEAFVSHVGTTSFSVGHRMTDADGALLATFVSTVVALREGAPVPVDASVRAALHEPLALPLEPPEPPESSLAFLRTFDAYASHENQGGHVARTWMVDVLDDVRRLALARGAFELSHPGDDGTVASIAMLYEREAVAGDGLRVAIAPARAGVFDAALVRQREVVARARFVMRGAV